MMNGIIIPVCQHCQKVPSNGLRDGFRLKGVFFCGECQRRMLSAYPGEPDYLEFLAAVRGTLEQVHPQPWVR